MRSLGFVGSGYVCSGVREAVEIALGLEEERGCLSVWGFESFHSLWLWFYIRLRPCHPVHILPRNTHPSLVHTNYLTQSVP